MYLSWLYHFFFIDIWKLFFKNRHSPIDIDDMACLNDELRSEHLTNALESALIAIKTGSIRTQLIWALWACFNRRYILIALLAAFYEFSMFFAVLVLRAFLLSDSSTEQYICLAALFALVWLTCLSRRYYEDMWRDASCRINISIKGLLFRQLLTKTWLDNEGHLSNLLTADCEKIQLLPKSSHFVLTIPFYIVSVILAIYFIYGWDALLAVPILLLAVLISIYFTKLGDFYMKKLIKTADLRLNTMQQSIKCMYTIKASQMEHSIINLVHKYREKELKFLLRHSFSHGFKNSLVLIIKFPTIVILIAAYLFVHGGALTASYIFSLALLYQCANMSTHKITTALKELLETNVAIGRIAKFLECSAFQESAENTKQDVKKLYYYALQSPGNLYQIGGTTGSGKTTLSKRLLVAFSNAKLNSAFYAQNVWLFNASIRENILCGRSFEQDRYWKVLSACQLLYDLGNTIEGDRKMIGENGIKLSGGQRARVALARTIYTVADIYIFDDPFKSLNAAVSDDVFTAVFHNFLHKQPRIVFASKWQLFSVTHGLLFRLEKDVGLTQVTEDLKRQNSDEEASDESNSYTDGDSETDPPETDLQQQSKSCITSYNDEKEAKEKTNLVTKLYKKKSLRESLKKMLKYFLLAPLWLSCTTWFLLLLGQLVLTLADVYVYFWVSCTESCEQWFFFQNYLLIALIGSVICISRALFLRYLCFVVAQKLHNLVVDAVIYAPMDLFWTTKPDNLLSRFSIDIQCLDTVIPLYMDYGVQSLLAALSYSIVIVCLYPFLLLAIVPAFLMIALTRQVSVIIGQEAQTISAQTLAPLVQRFASAASGLLTIRSLGLQKYLKSHFYNLIDRHFTAMLTSLNCNTFFINAVGVTFSTLISILLLIIILVGGDSSTAGLALYFAIQLLYRCQLASYYIGTLEIIMIHFFRLLEYSELQTEQKLLQPATQTSQKPLPHDPQRTQDVASDGGIEICHVGVKYKGSPNWAIKDKNLFIQGGLITGIAGRTGCGKSSLLSALIKITPFKGKILINGRRSSSMSLSGLRSCFAMLTQDSMTFDQESIRWNVDPYQMYSDESIWAALEVLGIKQVVTSLCFGLNTLVKDSYLSLGQVRLLCFARVLLNSDGKIVLLDEPTDSVDASTEAKIWEAVAKKLNNRTIVVVAHSKKLLKLCERVIQLDSAE